MMINAIDLLQGRTQDPANAAYQFNLGKLEETLEAKRGMAFTKLVEEIEKTKSEWSGKQDAHPDDLKVVTSSGTYGLNDPLTLSFLAEVVAASTGNFPDWLSDYATKAAECLFKLDPAKPSNQFFYFKKEEDRGSSRPLSNAFVPLRIVRARSKLGVQDDGKSPYLRYFESTLHDQLSFSSIPDSRFDPAELIFCLEGMLRLSEQSVDTPMFERMLDVLEAAQQSSAHWRPNKPFLRNERGLVLFPVSVEAANSLLWSCATLGTNERFYRYSQRYIALFRRFWGWLAARRVILSDKLSGWHSDHIADPDSIQLWDTAQVVEFLLGYRLALHKHIARTTLRLARFHVRKPEKVQHPWSEETRSLQGLSPRLTNSGPSAEAAAAENQSSMETQAAAGRIAPQTERPPTVTANFEPVTSLGNYFKTYEKIEKAFLRDWLEGKPSNFSMLLYGPPGTGKTTVAEKLADALCFDMITITVSDFLAEGGSDIEARAKMIFEVLGEQARSVILLDEIDELVLDRSSKRHGMQDTVFKFMTPGMLTKLNNLRRTRRCIFVMATNYAYRIDPAIRRTGRIDENYLLLPPDAESRKRMILSFLKNAKLEPTHELHPDRLNAQSWEELAQASFFLGYKDMEAAVAHVLREPLKSQTVPKLARELLKWGRTTNLRFYKEAFRESDDRGAVEREFLPLVRMVENEGQDAAKEHDASDIDVVVKEIKKPKEINAEEEPIYKSSTELKEDASKFVTKQNDAGA